MSSIPKAFYLLPRQTVYCSNVARVSKVGNRKTLKVLWFNAYQLRWSIHKMHGLRVKAVGGSIDSVGGKQGEDRILNDIVPRASDSNRRDSTFQGMICALPPIVTLVNQNLGSNYAIAFYIASAVMLVVARQIISGKKRHNQHGSVAELVRRGQLRSDRRGISKPMNYEDPFNNPQVKIGKDNSKITMCGKVYSLAPVTLTKEEQLIHQRRRSQAYQWKRPMVFLKEGDVVPPDVDPDTIRWIPSNHPFATTASEIDESLAQNNVFQKDGVPFRVRAEHEALQKKLEAIQSAQNEILINQKNIHDPERSVESSSKQDERQQNPLPGERTDHSISELNDKMASSDIKLPDRVRKF